MKEAKSVKFQEWNEKFLRVFWVSMICGFLAAFVLYIKFDDVEHCSKQTYFQTFVAIPTLVQAMICSLLEFYIRVLSRHIPNHITAMIVAAALEIHCGVMVMVHTSVGLMAMTLVLPLILATVYNSRSVLFVQSILACVIYVATQLVIVPNTPYMPENDALTYIIIFVALTAATVIWMNMMIRWQIEVNDEVEEYRQRDIEREQQTKIDSLTGLWNHKAFIETLEERMQELSRLPGRCMLLLFDIDGLYHVNEQYGYIRGDEVILKLTEILNRNTRSNDYAARYNGEEFMLILDGASAEIARQISDRIQKEFHACVFEKCGNERFTVSAGIAPWQDTYMNNLDFVSKAEQALRAAKARGYGGTGLYESE